MRRYPGLASFTSVQKDVFFGRKDDIQELSELIFVERKVLLYSKSGYGKTSLLNAGVIPKLSDNKNFEFITIRFRSYTEKSLSPNQTFLQTIRQHSDFNFSDKPETIIDKYEQGQENNFWSIFKKNQLSGNKHKTYVLVFDQFEELFTYPQAQIDEFKQGFAEIILENQYPAFFDDFEDAVFDNKENIPKDEIDLLYNNINIKSVFAMRSDRLSELNALADKITDIQKVFYELQPLDKEQAKQAIINPAKQKSNFDSKAFTYEKAALKKIINALTKKDKIETTQLQIVCQRLEEDIIAAKKTDAIISEKDIPAFEDIFRDFYHDATSKVNIEERDKVRKFIEDQLIIDSRRISLDTLVCQKYVNSETLKKLVDTRLLRAEPNTTGGFSYELSHDTLVSPITEIAKKRRDEEEKERLREKQRRQIRIITLAILVSAVSVGAAIFGFWQKSIADTEKEKATNALNDLQEEQRLREIEKQKRDSLNFHFYLNEGINQKENGEYGEAIQSLNFALKFDSTEQIIDLITECESKVGIEKRFNDLLSAGQNFEQRGKDFYVEAMQKYRQAQALDYNNQLIENEILRLNGKIDAFIQEAKLKSKYLIGTDNENAIKLWLQPAIKMRPNDTEVKKLITKASN